MNLIDNAFSLHEKALGMRSQRMPGQSVRPQETRTMSRMTARYPGTCRRTGATITPGDIIDYDRRTRSITDCP